MTYYKLLQKGKLGYWEERYSPKGNPYWLWRRAVPPIQDYFLNVVIYVYESELDAKNGEKVGGSGFLFGVPSKRIEKSYHIYAVTNRHVAKHPNNPTPTLRINKKSGGFDTVLTNRDMWIGHPNGDDIAVLPIGIKTDVWKFNFFASDKTVANANFFKKYDIGVGDEVFMTGRFINHEGKQKNIPSVRFGNISMMPDEPVYNRFTKVDQESYLVEMRSIPGYSGSPVIVYTNPFWIRPNKDDIDWTDLEFPQKLLGIDWGHLIMEKDVLEEDGAENKDGLKVNLDTNMAMVVPIYKLEEMLEDKELVEMRKQTDKKHLEKIRGSGAVTDSAEDEAFFTQENMDEALKKAFKPKDGGKTSDEEK